MKTKKLTPRNAAPVQRENTATVSRDGNAIAPDINSPSLLTELWAQWAQEALGFPFAGDDAE
jgi:prenylated cyclic peptide (anacyclamide/piricyclamide family)